MPHHPFLHLNHCPWCGSRTRTLFEIGCQRSAEPHGWHAHPADEPYHSTQVLEAYMALKGELR